MAQNKAQNVEGMDSQHHGKVKSLKNSSAGFSFALSLLKIVLHLVVFPIHR